MDTFCKADGNSSWNTPNASLVYFNCDNHNDDLACSSSVLLRQPHLRDYCRITECRATPCVELCKLSRCDTRAGKYFTSDREKKPLKWDKTDHKFPTASGLVRTNGNLRIHLSFPKNKLKDNHASKHTFCRR